MRLSIIAATAALAFTPLALPGCSLVGGGSTSASVNMASLDADVKKAAAGYKLFLDGSTLYMEQARCGPATKAPPFCSDQDFIDSTLVPTRNTIGAAVRTAINAVRTMPDNPSRAEVYVRAATAAVNSTPAILKALGR